ncbi:hypothetical protein RHMOL_Rhmol08G0258300 [Rhododendron molle]|uniref:Uncharacterized protein n=1 Tax=Rhododendron molle TaxID=49168 RepID=A0ACC0MSL0_RHOML|nr:hypothetical protein RHMOL_Rhmol08G0258300 [Rhododendron molle]
MLRRAVAVWLAFRKRGIGDLEFYSSNVVELRLQGGMRVYICDHDTAPPDDQLIKTNQTNILIRSLMLKKQKGDSSSKDIKGASPSEASRKRPAERALDGRASTKRGATNNQAGSRQEGSRSRVPEKDFQSLTVERLRALLKEKGLSRNGKKASRQNAYSHRLELLGTV